VPHWGFWVWKQRGRWACAGGGFCYDLDVPREQGLQRRFLLGDTTELLCSHTLSLPRLLERAEPFDRLRVNKLGPYKGKTESARPRRRPLNRG